MNAIARRILTSAALVATSFSLTACFTVPETGRSSLSLIPEGQMAGLGTDTFEQMKQQKQISTNPQYNAQVERVGRRIANAVGDDIPYADWEFVVFEDPAINAFALPGGKVGIYTGMLDKIVQSDDDLAVVMGHEIAHVAARHSGERLSQTTFAELLTAGVGISLGEMDNSQQAAIMTAFQLSTGLGLLGASRFQESEADEIGLMYAARAGYDPRVAPSFWQRMSEQGGAAPPEFFSTHPPPEKRIQRLRALQPEAIREYQQATGQRLR